MKKLILLAVFASSLFVQAEDASAGPCRSGGGYNRGGNNRTVVRTRTVYRRSYRSSFGGGGGWGGGRVVVVNPPEPRPNLPIVHLDENVLEAMAADKFCALNNLDPKENRLELVLVSRDFHSDTGALKKVKFKVKWVEFKITKDKDGKEIKEEKAHDTTIKLKFDEFGRFTSFDD